MRRARRSATRSIRVQGEPPADARRPHRAGRAAARARARARLAAPEVEGVEADDVIGTLAKRAREQGIDTTISTVGQGLRAARRARHHVVNTMSNETLDEAGVVAKFGVRADQRARLPHARRRLVDNVPGVDKARPEDRDRSWIGEYGSLDGHRGGAVEIGGKVGRELRERSAGCRGPRAPHREDDCDLPLDRATRACRPTARAGRALRPLRVPAAGCARSRAGRAGRLTTPPARSRERCEGRDAPLEPERGDHVRGKPRSRVRDRARRRDVRALEAAIARRAARRLRHRDDQPRPDARPIWSGSRSRSRPGRPATSRSRTATPGAPDQLDRERCSPRSRRWFADPARAQRRPELQVRPARAREPRHRARRRRARHAAGLVLRARGAPAPRHGQPRVAPPRDWKTIPYNEVCGKGAKQIYFDQVTVEARDRVFLPRTPTSRCACTRCCVRRSPRREARAALPRARDAVCRCCSGMERAASCLDTRRCCAAEHDARRARAGTRAAGLRSSPAARSTWARPSSWARSCSSA